MQYKIIVDKQPMSNPSSEKKEYVVNIEELRVLDKIHDSLIFQGDETYVIRRLKLSEYGVLSVLPNPKKEVLTDIDIILFEGDNYIYILNEQGNTISVSYLIKSDFTENFPTKIEMYSAINQSAGKVLIEVNKKVDADEFATYLEVNSEAVKVSWNKISQYIQMEILNQLASLVIRDGSQSLLMALNQNGQQFFENNELFAEIGVKKVDYDKYVAFSVPSKYGEDIQNGMAWGLSTPDGKYWPILYIKNFHMANQSAGDFSGELVLNSCNLRLDGTLSGIICGGVKLYTASALGGVAFIDENTGENLITVMPNTEIDESRLDILDKISFFRNVGGGNTLRIGLPNADNCTLTDDGHASFEKLTVTGDAFVTGNITCNKVTQTSLAEQKKNFEKMQDNAIDIIKNIDIYKYNLKSEKDTDKKHIGFVIGKGYNYSKEVTSVENDGVDNYSFTSLCCKAIQEQQKIIESLQEEIRKLKEVSNG